MVYICNGKIVLLTVPADSEISSSLKKETVMGNDITLCKRAFNFGLKIAANVYETLTPEQVEYYEGRPHKIPSALIRGFVVGADERFELVSTFNIIVPSGYRHAARLASFNRLHRHDFWGYNNEITDEHYCGATTKLIPGQRLKVRVFEIDIEKKTRISSEDCLAYLHSEKAVLTGAQGASLVWELKCKELPADEPCISFDEKDALWKPLTNHLIPFVNRYTMKSTRWGTGGEFELYPFEIGLHKGSYLLCFNSE